MAEGTIYALSSSGGRAGVAVFRLSGDGCRLAWERLTGREVPEPRMMTRVRVRDGSDVIDEGLGVFFPKPRSFTGEDVVEFHVHGGRAIVQGLLGALAKSPGLRPAEAGEFTRRAFENGKMDLTEAEAVIDLIDADTETQRRQALRQKDGEFGKACERWRVTAIRVLGLVEAAIDFSDEGLGDGLVEEARKVAVDLRLEIDDHLRRGERGRKIREGFYVAIVGEPNVGKSSLLNRLAGRDAAIVSETAGTTRDVIEVRMALGGYAVTLADTAGLREGAEAIEEEGIRRAKAAADRADLRLEVLDARDEDLWQNRAGVGNGSIAIANKADLIDEGGWSGKHPTVLPISAKTGYGLDALENAIIGQIAGAWETRDDGVVWTRERHRLAMAAAVDGIGRFLRLDEEDLAAEEIRRCVRELGKIVGKVDVEDVLDMIFREFCIGK